LKDEGIEGLKDEGMKRGKCLSLYVTKWEKGKGKGGTKRDQKDEEGWGVGTRILGD
jgi:hypothetical protein